MPGDKNIPERNSSQMTDLRSRDLHDFKNTILEQYLSGNEDHGIVADERSARSLMPPSTGKERSFAAISPEIPEFFAASCVACMECVILCPDVAIRTRAVTPDKLDESLSKIEDEETRRQLQANFLKTRKLWNAFESKGETPAYFSLWIDPDRCKGCGVCVEVCGSRSALKMIHKEPEQMKRYSDQMTFMRESLPPTRDEHINEKRITDLYLKEQCWVCQGGSGSCAGCGEVSAINMALTATSVKYGKDIAIVASTGCNSVYSATYPYNIFDVPWTNSLFENAPAMAMGVRMRLDQNKKDSTKIWVIGGDGAMYDIGFQSLSRMLTTSMDINVLVLDTQSYSNTGGQASTATFLGQNAKMSVHGSELPGKIDRRKELGLLAMNHPNVFVAQVSPSYYTHFFKAVIGALEFPGPSVIIAYSACTPEHQIADNMSYERGFAAVNSRAFPLFVHDPRGGATFRERLSLAGNPSSDKDWHVDSKTGEKQDFVWFARGEGRFSKQFNADGNPSDALLLSQDDRLRYWHLLQELAGIRNGAAATTH
jgi:pyruvate/2-oxoacid:ferredoxin oxidoreductase beta subunit/Pyruvate/2-oxoacid:ferredoxin oxidoreductase delta subunit